jgi:Spy/CpxP family protein refolding chaperone
MRTLLIAFASSLALSAAAFAQTDKSSVPDAEHMAHSISATAGDSKEIVCHHLVHQGMLMSQEVCLTKRAWERMRQQTQRTIDEIQVRSFSRPVK